MSEVTLLQGGKSPKEIIHKLQGELNRAINNSEPLIISFEKSDYTFGHYEDQPAFLKFGIRVLNRIAGNLQDQTGVSKQIILEVLLLKAKEEVSSEQKTDAEKQKPLH